VFEQDGYIVEIIILGQLGLHEGSLSEIYEWFNKDLWEPLGHLYTLKLPLMLTTLAHIVCFFTARWHHSGNLVGYRGIRQSGHLKVYGEWRHAAHSEHSLHSGITLENRGYAAAM
jgi:hypothetical protein